MGWLQSVRRRRRYGIVAVVVGWTLLAVSCSGSDTAGGPVTTIGGSASPVPPQVLEVTAASDERLDLSPGATLTVGAGAVATDGELRVQPVPDATNDDLTASGFVDGTTVVDIDFDGTLNRPFIIDYDLPAVTDQPVAEPPVTNSPVAAVASWPWPSYFEVPQLGTEPVRGSGCGADGSLGDTLPDGYWAGYIRSISDAAMAFDVACIYYGDSARPYIVECFEENGDDWNCDDYASYWTENNSDRTRPVPLADDFIHHLATWSDTDSSCQDRGVLSSDPDGNQLWEVIDSWVQIVDGQAVFALTSCPYG